MAAMLAGLTGVVKGLSSGAAKSGMSAFSNMLSGIGNSITTFMSGQSAMEGVVGVFQQLIDALNPFTPIFQTLSDIFSVFGDIIAAKMAPVMQKLFQIMLSPPVLALVEKLGDIFAKLFLAFTPILDVLVKVLVPILDPILTLLASFADILVSLAPIIQLSLLPLTILSGILTALKPVIDILASSLSWFAYNVIKPIANFIITVANGLIDLINMIPGVHINRIPALATGGDIEGSGIAKVHKNEKVLNAAETELYRALVDNSTTSTTGGDINVTLNNSGAIGVDDIASQLTDKIGENLARRGFDFRR